MFAQKRQSLSGLVASCLCFALIISTQAAKAEDEAVDLSAYGLFYNSYEPSFYTGFAPRTSDPRRLHLHVGRGNQLRMTLVLSDEMISNYARNLAARHLAYKKEIDAGKVVLTQNAGFAEFEKTLKSTGLEALISETDNSSPEEVYSRNLELMEKLNPGRVFRISIPVRALAQNWVNALNDRDYVSMDADRRLELLNHLLPTRLWITELDEQDSRDLKDLVDLAGKNQEAPVDVLITPYLKLLQRISGGIYPLHGDRLEFVEFTAIHPVGSFNSYVTHKGKKIPQYPTPGRRALTYHQRTKTVDHIPDVAVYGYLPWIPYMHVGKRLHNSFHTLWWRMNPQQTSFLPEEITTSERALAEDGKPYTHLWLLSRGPMSHGCTHVNAGHISELREMLPAQPEDMEKVDVFINKSHLFDVFDIDGDLIPEVMGVAYFVAYSLKDKKPDRLRAPTERKGFYDWLYGGELKYHEDASGWFTDIQDAHYKGRKAVDGRRYENIDLYEARYEPEKIQFYHMVDIPFARAMRRVGNGDELPVSR